MGILVTLRLFLAQLLTMVIWLLIIGAGALVLSAILAFGIPIIMLIGLAVLVTRLARRTHPFLS